jgi:methionyl aminopeptidase
MIQLKTQEDIETMKEGGRIHARILRALGEAVQPNVSAMEIDTLARALMEEALVKPAFLGYTPEGVSYPYPAAVCISVNDEVVHGIPEEDILFQEGDIVSLDIGILYKGLITDGAITVPCGEVSDEAQKLINITKEALAIGVKAAQPGNTVGDIGYAIETFVAPHGYGIIKILAGHGVGYSVHEDPYIPNYGRKGEGEKLVPGMVIAIEPMLTLGTDEVAVTEDEYTYVTYDGSLAAHFEHTIAITEEGPIILTK